MIKEEFIGKNLEELNDIFHKKNRNFSWMVCTACWTFPILNGIFPNNMNFVLGGMSTTLIPFFLTFKEGISFMKHYDF